MHTAYTVSKACVCSLRWLTGQLKVSVYMGYVPSLGIRGPRSARSILFQSSGLTNGIIEEKDIPEELPRQKEKQQEEGEDHNDLDSDQESVDEEADVSMLHTSCLSLSAFFSINNV